MTIGLTWRRTARRIKRLKQTVLAISPDYLESPDPRLFDALLCRHSCANAVVRSCLNLLTAWFEQLRNDGKFKGGGPLVHDGKIVRDRNAVIDGPFAESKEAIGGFLMIQAD